MLIEEKPELIFTFDPQKQYIVHDDFHPDHRTLATAVVDVVLIDSTLPLKVKTPIAKPQLYLYNAYRSNIKIDIKDHLFKKKAALKVFKSQKERLGRYSTCVEKFRVYTNK